MTQPHPLIEPAAYAAMTGREVGLSRWFTLSQREIDQFAACTGDRQFIHTDPDRARNTPFGGTIAHGFLTLSMLAEMLRDIPAVAGVSMSVNYGLNRLRFLSPVPVDSRLRGRFILQDYDEIAPGQVQTTYAVTVEIEGSERPALVAEWLVRHHLGADGGEPIS